MEDCGAIPRRYFTRSPCSNDCCQSPPSWTFAPNLRNSAWRGAPTAALRRSELRQYSSILPAPADRDNCPSLSGCMAAKTKCLASNDKRRTSAKPTIPTSLHPGYPPPVVQIGTALVLAGGLQQP